MVNRFRLHFAETSRLRVWLLLALLLFNQYAIASHQHQDRDEARPHHCLVCMQLQSAKHAACSQALLQPVAVFDDELPFSAVFSPRAEQIIIRFRSRAPPFYSLIPR